VEAALQYVNRGSVLAQGHMILGEETQDPIINDDWSGRSILGKEEEMP